MTGYCEYGKEPLESIKDVEFFYLSERLSIPEGLYSIE
jgi:hypothetical protein